MRQTLLINSRPTLKNVYKNKGNNFLKNIKEDLTSLKNQVDRIITNQSEETTYDEFGLLKNIKQSNSENNSEC